MIIAGFDIGGATTDLALIEYDENNEIKNIEIKYIYLPMWYKKEDLKETLEDLKRNKNISAVAISMTAELVDAYESKKEGVLDIAGKCMEIFDVPIAFLSSEGLISYEELLKKPLTVAAANWIGTSALISEIEKDCIFLDIGSTTTDIIPLKNGKECAVGRTDFERLGSGELVYTGMLRTNLCSITDKIDFNGKNYRLASELFSTSADIHYILGNIKENDYISETADGSGKSIRESMLRVSRVLCADLEILNQEDIKSISEKFYKEQINQVSEALDEVAKRENLKTVIATGLGVDSLAYEAIKKSKLNPIKMTDYYSKDKCIAAPALGTAMLMKDYLNIANF